MFLIILASSSLAKSSHYKIVVKVLLRPILFCLLFLKTIEWNSCPQVSSTDFLRLFFLLNYACFCVCIEFPGLDTSWLRFPHASSGFIDLLANDQDLSLSSFPSFFHLSSPLSNFQEESFSSDSSLIPAMFGRTYHSSSVSPSFSSLNLSSGNIPPFPSDPFTTPVTHSFSSASALSLVSRSTVLSNTLEPCSCSTGVICFAFCFASPAVCGFFLLLFD